MSVRRNVVAMSLTSCIAMVVSKHEPANERVDLSPSPAHKNVGLKIRAICTSIRCSVLSTRVRKASRRHKSLTLTQPYLRGSANAGPLFLLGFPYRRARSLQARPLKTDYLQNHVVDAPARERISKSRHVEIGTRICCNFGVESDRRIQGRLLKRQRGRAVNALRMCATGVRVSHLPPFTHRGIAQIAVQCSAAPVAAGQPSNGHQVAR
jgi:hypothetical protein